MISTPGAVLLALARRGWTTKRVRSHSALVAECEAFSEGCIKHLNVEHGAFFGFSGESLEALRFDRNQGVMTIVDQVDPGRVYHRVLAEEGKRFAHLALAMEAVPEVYYRRLQMEWSEADHIVVNSNWTRGGLVGEGVPAEKIKVIPVAYRSPEVPRLPRSRSGRLRVLYLGRLCLAKGFAYALQSAGLVKHLPIAFTFAGPSAVRHGGLTWPANATYVGAVPRMSVAKLYQEHDVFLFPTLSDGFGITQLEAMAFGLPVIATRCCGDVVVDGQSGFIVEPRNPRAIADSLVRLLDMPDLLEKMSTGAVGRAADFSPAKIWLRYKDVLA